MRRSFPIAGLLLVACSGPNRDAVERADPPEPARPVSDRGEDADGLPVVRGAHVLLITVDALRADRLGGYGYERGITPGIDAIAERGVTFERAYAQAPHSSWSLCSLMTSEYLHESARLGRGVPSPTLAAEFAAAGHHTVAYYTDGIYYTDGEDLAQYREGGLGFEERLRDNPAADARTDRVLEVVDRLVADGEPPSFLWVHYFDPHEPYEDTSLGTTTPDRYDAEVRNADRGVSRLVEEARARLSRDVVVVISADHGEELRDHGGVSHGSTLYDEQVRVPLIVQVPGLAPRRVAEPVELVDVAPTLLRLSGIEAAPTMRGDDLRPLLIGRDVDVGPAFAGVASRRMVVEWPLKLVADLPRGHLRLYDLAQDPGERHDLSAERDPGPLVARVHLWHDSLRAPPGREASADPAAAALDRGRLEDDRAIGPLASLVADPAADARARADAARVLSSLDDRSACDALAGALSSEPPVSVEAAIALGALGDLRASRPLRRLLETESDPDLRARAAIALGSLGSRHAVPGLVEIVRGDHGYDTKRDAVARLYRLRDPRAVPALLELMEDSHHRYRAITALGLTGDETAFEPLMARLAGPTRVMVRDGLVRAFGWLGDRRAIPRIAELAASEPELVYATESLVRLDALRDGQVGGADVGPRTRGRRGFGRCHRGDPFALDYRWLTWCETEGPRATLRLSPLEVPPGRDVVAVLSARRADGEGPAAVVLEVGGERHAFTFDGAWAERRVVLGTPELREATLHVEPAGARVAVDHLLLLPADP